MRGAAGLGCQAHGLPLVDARIFHMTIARGNLKRRMRLDSFSNLVSELDAIVAWSNVMNLIFEPYGWGLHFALQPGSWGHFLHMRLVRRILRVGADPPLPAA